MSVVEENLGRFSSSHALNPLVPFPDVFIEVDKKDLEELVVAGK